MIVNAQLIGADGKHYTGDYTEGDATTFTGFETMIDAVGGLEVENPYDLYDGEFPTPDYGTKEIFFPAGTIHLNGYDALDYVRTRHQDSDDGRVMRQRLVLLSMLQKVTSDGYRDQLPSKTRTSSQTASKGLLRVAQSCGLATSLGSLPRSRYLRAVFSSMSVSLAARTIFLLR